MIMWTWLAENIELNEPITMQIEFHGWTIHLLISLDQYGITTGVESPQQRQKTDRSYLYSPLQLHNVGHIRTHYTVRLHQETMKEEKLQDIL